MSTHARFCRTLNDCVGLRGIRSGALAPPDIAFGVLHGAVYTKGEWKKFMQYIFAANPDLFYGVTGKFGALDAIAVGFADKLALSFGDRGTPYTLTLADGTGVGELPVVGADHRMEKDYGLSVETMRTAIDRLLLLVRKQVLRNEFAALSDVSDTQMLADIRAQLRICHESRLWRVLVHNGKLEHVGMNPYDAPILVGMFAQKYGGEFVEAKRLFDSITMPAHNAYSDAGGVLRYAYYDAVIAHYITEFQYTALKAALCSFLS